MRPAFLLCAILTACNTPSPPFRDIAPTRITVDGSVFDVRVRADLVEAVRVNPQYAPRLGPIRDRARRAMQHVSGCPIAKVTGDQSLLLGQTACSGAAPPPRYQPVLPGGALECETIDSYTIDALNERVSQIECTWVP